MRQLVEIAKCDNTVYADEIKEKLGAEGIVCLVHDENEDTVVGAYGGTTGISIRVYEEDAEKARDIVKGVRDSREDITPWCPRCGSEDVTCTETRRVRPKNIIREKRWNIVLWAVVLVVALYFGQWPFAIACLFLLLFDLFIGKKANYHCNNCGEDFMHER